MKEIQEMHGRGPSRAIRRGIGCGRRDPENPTRNTASAEPREPEAAASPRPTTSASSAKRPGAIASPQRARTPKAKATGTTAP